MTVRLVYFAWVRERIGRSSESVDLPADVRTVKDVMTWLTARDATYAHAFEQPEIVRAALDQVHASPDAPIANAREIAFFPPVTGG